MKMELYMDLNERKLKLVQLILSTEEPALLKKVEEVLNKEKSSDWWDDISDQERKLIEESIAEANQGMLIPHEEVMKEFRDRFGIE